MTVAMHRGHADVPIEDGRTLDDIATRRSCYTCHPGFDTQCLRGAMGKAVGPDGGSVGGYAMDCQSCHGGMSDVGNPARVGWLDQPTCQKCHTGSATLNSGAIRFTSVFDAQGHPNVAASNLFATEADAPQTGFSLYRFSTGHGGLQCSACHGPHGMHATTQKWVTDVHKDEVGEQPVGLPGLSRRQRPRHGPVGDPRAADVRDAVGNEDVLRRAARHLLRPLHLPRRT